MDALCSFDPERNGLESEYTGQFHMWCCFLHVHFSLSSHYSMGGSFSPQEAQRTPPAWAPCPIQSWHSDRPLAAHQSSCAALESPYHLLSPAHTPVHHPGTTQHDPQKQDHRKRFHRTSKMAASLYWQLVIKQHRWIKLALKMCFCVNRGTEMHCSTAHTWAHKESKEDKSSNVTTHTNTLAWSRQLEGGEVGVSTVSAWLKLPALPLTPPGLINLTCIGSTPRDASAAYFPVDERNRNGLGGGKRGGKERDRTGEGQKGTVEQEKESKPDQTCTSAVYMLSSFAFPALYV